MPRYKKENIKFMNRALSLARKAKGRTFPNPMVGAVIVREGRIVGEGFHKKAGLPHAEKEAIKASGERARGSVLYVTLEPCSHYGKTPPCAGAIIKSGIKKVYAATKDPNPLVMGRGFRELEKKGVKISVGPCGAEARKLNKRYIDLITGK